MIRLIAFSPIDGAAFYEVDGKTFHTCTPFTPSTIQEVENAQECAETTMGYLDGQNRTFPDFNDLKVFIWDFRKFEIKNNPALKRNRELLVALEESKEHAKYAAKQESPKGRPIVKQLDSKMDSQSLAKNSQNKLPAKRRGKV